MRPDAATINVDVDGVLSVDGSIAGGLVYKGSLQITQNSAVDAEPLSGEPGHTYTASESGTIAGASQTTDWASLIGNVTTTHKVTAGDLIVCRVDGGGAGNWTLVMTGGNELWRKSRVLVPTNGNDYVRISVLGSSAGNETQGTAVAMFDDGGRFRRAEPKNGIEIDGAGFKLMQTLFSSARRR